MLSVAMFSGGVGEPGATMSVIVKLTFALAAAFGDAWTSLQTQTGAGAQAIAAIVYRDQMLEIRFKPAVKLSIEAAQAVLATHALQARVMNVEGEAGVWQVRSVQ